MSSAALLKRFQQDVEMVPVEGFANVCIFRPKSPATFPAEGPQMTDADWDKFEADIEQAFEQLP